MAVCFFITWGRTSLHLQVSTYTLRGETEKTLLYHLYVDSMPTEDVPPLTVEQVNRVLGFALNSRKLRDKLMDTSQFISEINIEYARTMNKIVFDDSMQHPEAAQKMLVQVGRLVLSRASVRELSSGKRKGESTLHGRDYLTYTVPLAAVGLQPKRLFTTPQSCRQTRRHARDDNPYPPIPQVSVTP